MTRKRVFFAAALLVTLVLAGVVSQFASSSPDGLEKVAHDKGFSSTQRRHGMASSPVAGYGVEGVGNARLSGGLAGVIGVAATLAIGGGLFLLLRRRAAQGAADVSRPGDVDVDGRAAGLGGPPAGG